ncbi:MAG: 8-oxoguanine deaminase [Ancalomicrobiaceae bacterium]|nr:8-oxoguanine deaminase [Ancalomicrobiaceae bacterium]
MRLWVKDPIAVLAQGAERGIVVEDGKIVELVGAGKTPEHADVVFDAGRHVVIPGLVNTHHHMFQTLTRAHPQGINKKLFDWLDALFPIWARHVTPDNLRLATRLAMTELMMSGCTTTTDHQYLFPPGTESAMDIQAEEAARVGVRMVLNRGSLNLTAEDGGNAIPGATQDHDTILADCERVIGRYHDASEGSMLQVALAPCAPFNVTKKLMIEAGELALKHKCRLHTHLGETVDEVNFCRDQFQCRPVDYLEEVGWLNDQVWLAHGIHFNDEEVARLGRHRVGVCHCPTSNMVLASGQCRTRELEAAGSPVGLGVDGSASNDNSNLMEGVRHALMINRLTYDATVSHLDALRWATEGSAACIGRTDIGRIAVGKQADLALYTLDELRFSGAGDPIAALVLCGAHRADRVMIAGQWKVADGLPIGVDLARLRAEHGEAARAFLTSI